MKFSVITYILYINLIVTFSSFFLPVRADSTGDSSILLPEEILQSSSAHFPQVLEALATRRAVQADILTADGAFDVVFSSDGFDRATGFWAGRVVNTQLRKKLKPLGGTVYGGYRISDGTFPIYEDINFTNTGGEFKLGALFSLLKNRKIDARRFQVNDANLALKQADLEVLLTRIGVQHQALTAYWRWVIAGQQLEAYEALLEIARQREAGIAKQVQKGAIAQIFITEYNQNILRRERLVLQAELDYQAAANDLSFYYRDGLGEIIMPKFEQIPNQDIVKKMMTLAARSEHKVSDVLSRRPELSLLRTSLQRAEGVIALKHNDLKPQLDIRAEVSRDFGNIAEGGLSRDSTDTIVGLRFSVPLQRREVKGKLNQTFARRDALRQQERRTRARIEVELRNILINLSMSKQLAIIAAQEVDQALLMQRAEQKRFEAGASDFFLLNIREERTADAQVRRLLAILNNNLSQVNYDAATLNLKRLGLTQESVAF